MHTYIHLQIYVFFISQNADIDEDTEETTILYERLEALNIKPAAIHSDATEVRFYAFIFSQKFLNVHHVLAPLKNFFTSVY